MFENKIVAIAGAGDSALDWVIDLHKIAKKVYLIHRSKNIKAHPASWHQVQEIAQTKNVAIKIPYVITKLNVSEEKLHSLEIEGENNETLNIDYLLPCYGLHSDSSFVHGWGIKMRHHRIIVDATTLRTSCDGIYAIGDCVYYNNKRKLILTGFSEAAQAALDIFHTIYADKSPPVGHSTTRKGV